MCSSDLIGGSARLGGGVRAGVLRVGAVAEWSPSRALTGLFGDRRMWAMDVSAGLGLAPRPWLDVGARLGLSFRSYAQDDDPVVSVWVPVLDVGVAAPLPVTSELRLAPFVDLEADLRRTELYQETGATTKELLGEQAGLQLNGGLGLQWTP